METLLIRLGVGWNGLPILRSGSHQVDQYFSTAMKDSSSAHRPVNNQDALGEMM